VTDRLLLDLGLDGRMVVSIMRSKEELPRPLGDPTPVDWPMNAAELEDLRWYLEEYLAVPFGVYDDRGATIAARLRGWGESLFASVFGSGPARDAYVRLRERATARGGVELVVRSAASAWLGLPWELMRDPAHSRPLALDGIGLTRSLPAAHLGDVFAVGGDRLRVLMVISRPRGTSDVGYQMIARPLLRRLAAVRGQVDVVVLRPPTLDALQTELRAARAAGEPFQIVHFDGHGMLDGERAAVEAGAWLRSSQPGHGVLVFEQPEGGPDEVPADRVAQVLAEAQVPVVVLNACQSGAVGKELEATVATRLLTGGAVAVVAMAYSVYAVAAAEFMTAFYDRLFTGDTVGEAVQAGRTRMAHRRDRPTPKGQLPLEDWLIPVHYRRQDVHFPHLRARHQADVLSLDRALDELHNPASHDSTDDLAPVGDFIGRDALFYALERGTRTHRVIVLHGPAGIGKTELAKAFGRWWRDTAGVDDPDLIMVHSFKPGVASFVLDGVIAAIGARAFGPDFHRHDPQTRRDVVHQLLAKRRALLIWDNFESVATVPDLGQATPPLDDAGRRELSDFLARIARDGRSVILITSRTSEPWLDNCTACRIRVDGLSRPDAISHADAVLAPFPGAAPQRADRAFEELMEWLDGHLLSMRVMLPHLDTTDAGTLLNGLRGITPLPGDDHTSLAASLTYSLAHLGSTSRTLLTAVALFDGVVYAAVLTMFSRQDHTPQRFRGFDLATWTAALDEAVHVGLLRDLNRGMYGIHPALPAYLVEQWRADNSSQYPFEHTAAERALFDTYVSYAGWIAHEIENGNTASALRAIHLQRRTLGRLLGYALDIDLWKSAYDIVWVLHRYWINEGLIDEARHWSDRILNVLEGPDGAPPPLDQPAGSLWLLVAGIRASRRVEANHLGSTVATFTDIYEMLMAQPAPRENQVRLAPTCLHLGLAIEERGQLDEAGHLYRQSLTIYEALDDQSGVATAYHRLAALAQKRGQLDEAERWSRQSLKIYENAADRRGMADTYEQLGTLARERGSLDKAEQWYLKALAIHNELGDRLGKAKIYHHFGTTAYLRELLDDAERWYQQALAVYDELGDRSGLAGMYYQLGMITRGRGHLDEAESWFRQALAISQEFGNQPSTAKIFGQLGHLSERRGDKVGALQWIVRCVNVFDDFPHPSTDFGPDYLALLTNDLGMDFLSEQWEQITGKPLPADIAAFVTDHDGRMRRFGGVDVQSARMAFDGKRRRDGRKPMSGDRSMSYQVTRAARAVAERLVTQYGVRLVADVDAIIQNSDEKREPLQYVDPVSIAALVVSTAGLAWTVYKDVRTRVWKPRPDVVACEVRLKLVSSSHISMEERDRIIEMVAEEIVKNEVDTATGTPIAARLTALAQTDPGAADRYRELGVFPTATDIPFDTLVRYWQATGGINRREAERLCRSYADAHLIEDFRLDPPAIRLDANVADYLQQEARPRTTALNRALLDSYRTDLPSADDLPTAWWKLPAGEAHLWHHLTRHLTDAAQTDELTTLLRDLRWASVKIHRLGPASVEADTAMLPGDPHARALRQLLRGTSHLYQPGDSMMMTVTTFATYAAGDPVLGAAARTLIERVTIPHLRPTTTPLPDQPHPGVEHILTGHVVHASALAVAPDGSWLASTGYADPVRVWNPTEGTELFALPGPKQGARALAVAPDGTWLAAGGYDGVVRVWDMPDGTERAVLTGHTGIIWALAVAPDGTWLASGGDDYAVRIWNMADGTARAVLSGCTSRVGALAVAPDGTWLAVASTTDRHQVTAWIWRCADGARVDLGGTEAYASPARALAIAPDGSWLASAAFEHVYLWNPIDGSLLHDLTGHSRRVSALAVATDGSWLASAGKDGTVRLWNPITGRALGQLAGHTGQINALAVAPDGSWLASAAGDNLFNDDSTVRVWNLRDRTIRAVLTGHAGAAETLTVAPDGSWLASGGDDHTVRLWNVAEHRDPIKRGGHTSEITALAMAPDGSWAASTGHDGTVRLWNTADGTERAVLHGHTDHVTSVVVAPDGSWLASAGHDGTVRLWNTTDGSARAVLKQDPTSVFDLVVAPDGSWLAATAYKDTLWIWDTTTGKAIAGPLTSETAITTLAVAGDGSWLAGAGDGGAIRLWDPTNGTDFGAVPTQAIRINALAAAPDGSWLASAGESHTIQLRNTVGGTHKTSLVGHTDGVLKLAVAPDASWLASVGRDHTARVWNVASGAQQAVIHHSAITLDIAVAPDGSWLASVGRDGAVRVFGPHSEVWASIRLGSQLRRCLVNPARPQLVVAGSRHVYFLDVHRD
jgi:WD40 repeat protein/tetratricopeptide (TPR) repeat protein